MQSADTLDPEQELRKRLQTRLTGEASIGQTEYGNSGYQWGGAQPATPIAAAPFANEAQPKIPPAAASPQMSTQSLSWKPGPDYDPATMVHIASTMPRAGEEPGYTPPDPPPYIPPVTPPAAPATTTPPPATDTRVGIPGGPETRPNTPTIEAATTQSAAPAGWDQTKWDDQGHTSTKYVVGRILAKYPATVQGLAQAFAEIKAQFPGASFNGKDTLSGLPGTAGPVDVLMNASSGGSGWWWGDSGASGGAGGGGGAGAGAGAGGAAGGGASSLTMPTSPFMTQLRDLLMKRIAAAQEPVDQNSAQIADPLSAARDEVSRGTDEERKRLAERLYAQGSLNSGELTQGITQSSERNATGLSQLRAGLISKEYTARRDELQNYMQLAIASGDAEMARQLQLEIANLNASVQREGLGLSLAEFLALLRERTANAGLNG